MNPTEWKDISYAPEGVLVWTAIIDSKGTRNVQKMKKSKNLWFIENGMYVYYQPTHWANI